MLFQKRYHRGSCGPASAPYDEVGCTRNEAILIYPLEIDGAAFCRAFASGRGSMYALARQRECAGLC